MTRRGLEDAALRAGAFALAIVVAFVIVAALGGCAPMRSRSKGARCAALSDRGVIASGVAAGGGVLAGASGLASIPVEAPGARVAVALGTVAFGAVAAAAVAIAQGSAEAFVDEGCGK